MGAGGAAPPVKSEDVMILIGSTILLTMLVIQAWSTPVTINCDEDTCDFFEVKYDLSEGDVFTLEVQEGDVKPTVILPDGKSDFEDFKDTKWEYTAASSGVHTFNFSVVDDSVIDYSISRGVLIDYGLYPVGIIILAFGILKRISKDSEDEPMEGLLED